MSAKGRVKYPEKLLPSLLEQKLPRAFDERSEPQKTKFFGVSARRKPESQKPKSFGSLPGKPEPQNPLQPNANEGKINLAGPMWSQHVQAGLAPPV